MTPQPAAGLPPQLAIAQPRTIADAVRSMHDAGQTMLAIMTRLERLSELNQETPEMHTVVINPANNGQYQVIDHSPWPAKSLGILNPGGVAVFIGVGGISARPGSRAPSCPGSSALVLPVEARDVEFGCDPAVLGSSTAVIYVFRYVQLQPLVLRQVP